MKARRSLIQICLLCAAMLPAVVQAQDAFSTNADGSIYTYSTNADGSANIVAYAGPPWVVTIPTNINGLTVTTIGSGAFEFSSLTNVTIPDSVTSIEDHAFFGCFSLTSVTIPNSVTTIGASAFAGCTSLTSVTIPNSITTIGEDAFANTALTSVTIPNSVTSIGDEAFYHCASLTAITADTNNPSYSSANGVLFNNSQNTLIEYPGGLGGSYTIPNSVTTIGASAFAGCTSLTSVTIPNSITSIGAGVFANTALTSVMIPNSVTSIGDAEFYDCTNLTGIYFQGNSPSPTNDSIVFAGDLATVYYLPGTTGWGAMFDGLPTAPWFLPNPQILNHSAIFGVQSGGFGFTISWATNASVVVEAARNLASPVWIPVSTNTLTGGTNYFSDPQWTNYPGRFYRIRSP